MRRVLLFVVGLQLSQGCRTSPEQSERCSELRQSVGEALAEPVQSDSLDELDSLYAADSQVACEIEHVVQVLEPLAGDVREGVPSSLSDKQSQQLRNAIVWQKEGKPLPDPCNCD